MSENRYDHCKRINFGHSEGRARQFFFDECANLLLAGVESSERVEARWVL